MEPYHWWSIVAYFRHRIVFMNGTTIPHHVLARVYVAPDWEWAPPLDFAYAEIQYELNRPSRYLGRPPVPMEERESKMTHETFYIKRNVNVSETKSIGRLETR